ncbi:unnamed protein product [Linum trigynum]|uniref:Protein EFFECTOR OF TRANSCRIPTION 2-like n=1 Tax=Linum trigynum TaxID=586398 RepID=A0AAV2GUJ6_9ROSI
MADGKGAKSVAVAADRLKREDCNRTKHDPDFSKWQVLIGPSDWADYSVGKEGAARYRVHNLPSTSSAGVYELGISVRRSDSGRELGKQEIVVVYLGQAESVRTRLQRYGRTGAHLGSSYSTGHWDEFKIDPLHKSAGLFEEIFSRGHSIVFRWAAMKDKRAAEKTESQLLETFDYAWNRGGNGARRPGDIVQKLDRIASATAASSRLRDISKKLMLSLGHQGAAVGIKIEASSKPVSPHKSETNSGEDNDSKNFLHRVFNFNKSRPRLVSDINCGATEEESSSASNVCGFIMADGIPCRSSPVAGRKRCEQHKGMRIYGSHNVKSSKATENNRSPGWEHSLSVTKCGATLVNGSLCSRRVGQGNGKCWQHQEKRVGDCDAGEVPRLSGEEGSLLKSELQAAVVTCGVRLLDGSACSRVPVAGRKRCLQHKGMRVN